MIPILPMRHGNVERQTKCKNGESFRSYLWGMETRTRRGSRTLRISIPILPMRHGNGSCLIGKSGQFLSFRSYLWGMETGFGGRYQWLFWRFRSYLWGMETRVSWCRVRCRRCIPILPMRHGNFSLFISPITSLSGFRSYLWGMETLTPSQVSPSPQDSDPTYEAWKQSIFLFIAVGNIIPILPMRHGNPNHKPCLLKWQLYSDPTYEAWKLNIMLLKKRGCINSDPTYEAWKPGLQLPSVSSITIPILPMRHGNKRWLARRLIWNWIPILPMRHGNSLTSICLSMDSTYSDPTYEAWKLVSIHSFEFFKRPIPILPMRHGNTVPSSATPTSCHLFRSYLWGMETSFQDSPLCSIRNSDPTYEAWKPQCSPYYQKWCYYSDPTYEAWKL